MWSLQLPKIDTDPLHQSVIFDDANKTHLKFRCNNERSENNIGRDLKHTCDETVSIDLKTGAEISN